MKKIVSFILCLVLLVSTLVFVACSPFYTGDRLATESDYYYKYDFFAASEYMINVNLRIDTSVEYVNHSNPEKNFVITGHKIEVHSSDRVSFFDLTYKSSSVGIHVQMWRDNSNIYFIEQYETKSNGLITRKFYQPYDHYEENMSIIQRYFYYVSHANFMSNLLFAELYGQGNQYMTMTDSDGRPVSMHLTLQGVSYRTQALMQYENDFCSRTSRVLMKPTSQSAKMPRIDGLEKGDLSQLVSVTLELAHIDL